MRKDFGSGAPWGLRALLLLILCMPLVSQGRSDSGGYLATFDASSSRQSLRLESLTRLSATPGPRIAELDGVSDWRLVFLDAGGDVLGDLAVPDPSVPLHGAAGAALPLTLRFPDWPDAILVQVRDASGRLVAEIALDATARGAAERSAERLGMLRKRMGLPAGNAAANADAREALYRQMAAGGADVGGRACEHPHGPWMVPEKIRSPRSCGGAEPAVSPASEPAVSSPSPRGMRGRNAGVRRQATRAAAARSAPMAETVTLQGRFRFPAGSTPPTTQFWLYAYGPEEGAVPVGQALVLPPDFTYSLDVEQGLPIALEVNEPPSPFLPARVDIGVVSTGQTSDLLMEQGVPMSGRLKFPDGVEPPTHAYVYIYATDANGVALRPRSDFATPPDFDYAFGVDEGWSVKVVVSSPSPFVNTRLSLGTITGAVVRDIEVERGAIVRGRILPSHGESLSGNVHVSLSGVESLGSLTATAPDYRYEFLARVGSMPTATPYPMPPFLIQEVGFGPLEGDLEQDIRLERGVALTHRFQAVGPLPDYVTWQMLDLASGRWRQLYIPTSQPHVAALPPRGAVAEVFADGYRASQGFSPGGGGDQSADFTLERLTGTPNVELHLRGKSGEPLSDAHVEIWRDQRYFAGAISMQGVAKLELADGSYRVRVWPYGDRSPSANMTRLLAEAPFDAPLTVAGPTQMTLQASPESWHTMLVDLPDEASFPGCGEKVGRFELLRGGQVVARGPFHSLQSQEGFGHGVTVGPGNYQLRYQMPGGVSYTSETFLARGGKRIILHRDGSAPQNIWTGILRDHQGNPLPGRAITVSDELGIISRPRSCPIATDANGRFRLPICQGCVFEFPASADSPAQRRIVHIDEPVTGSRSQDLRLGQPLAFAPLAAGGATRILGRGDEPIKLVFLAEGYTAEKETFTDSNGNGVWDGVQLVDVNGNGVYDSGEPYARYGNAVDPVQGQAPGSISEVIQDRNGDGVLSLDDRALFERNVQDYLRGLFSSHQFSSYRAAYQASAVMTYSRQAGMDHGAAWQRDTVFGGRYDGFRGLVEVDYGLASGAASEASPDHTVVVVMINQPVPYGRVNAFILAGGGVLASGINDNVAAHEFGHNPGRLGDEYAEFIGVHNGGSDLSFHNSTRFVDRDMVAWGDLVPESLDGRPTRPWMERSGFFQGSGYYSVGKFRPSYASMMRYMDSLLFNEASVRQLARVHARAIRGREGLLTVDERAAACRGYSVRWDVASLGVANVALRAGAPDGPILARGGAAGTAKLKSFRGDVYLMDAANGVVLDIEAEPLLRCTQSTPTPPAQTRPPVVPPAGLPGTGPTRPTPPVQGRKPIGRGPEPPHPAPGRRPEDAER